MIRLLVAVTTLGALVGGAAAQPAKKAPKAPPVTATLPVVGEAVSITGSATWGKRDWLYDVPSQKDAAGKVVLHWFCSPKVKTCADDLARIVTLKENDRVYIVAHVAGSTGEA